MGAYFKSAVSRQLDVQNRQMGGKFLHRFDCICKIRDSQNFISAPLQQIFQLHPYRKIIFHDKYFIFHESLFSVKLREHPQKIFHIHTPRRFHRRMHGKLGDTDIRSRD